MGSKKRANLQERFPAIARIDSTKYYHITFNIDHQGIVKSNVVDYCHLNEGEQVTVLLLLLS